MESENKRTSLGVIPVTKVAKLPEFKQWQSASEKFSAAKSESQQAKERMRAALKKRVPQLASIDNLDFLLIGEEISVYSVPTKATGARKRSAMLLDVE
jgi:hypothetical protein